MGRQPGGQHAGGGGFTFDPDGLTKPCAELTAQAGYFPVASGGILVRDGTLVAP